MTKLSEILAYNLRKNRRNSGFSQTKLAEMVNVSTHHIATIETARNFPALDLVERLARALNIEIYELFLDPHSSNKEFERLRQVIRSDMEELFVEFLERGLPDKRKKAARGKQMQTDRTSRKKLTNR